VRKVFMQLLAEFRRLGATIVSACFNKVIICTGKSSMETAKQYLEFLIGTIQDSESQLFSKLRFLPKTWWRSLLYMDRANFGGVGMHVDMEDGAEEAEEMRDEDKQEKNKVVCEFNVAKFLPKDLQLYFNRIIVEYISAPLNIAAGAAAAGTQLGGAEGDEENMAPTQSAALSQAKHTEGMRALSDVVSKDMTRQLCRMVDAIEKRQHQGVLTELDFPKMAGSHLRPQSPALEFVKTVTAVMSVDAEMEREVAVVRRTLLRLLRVQEFAPEATFKNPCKSFTLPDVICAHCNYTRDLDLCRDDDVVAAGQEGEDSEQAWPCPECHNPYSKWAIESELVTYLQRFALGFAMGDLACTRCRRVKGAAENLSSRCQCSGDYAPIDDGSRFASFIQTFHEIGTYHGFEWLRETAAWHAEQQGIGLEAV